MADADVVRLPDPEPEEEIPETLLLGAAPDMRLSPNDMRELKAETGRTLTELTGEGADEADSMQTMAWLKMRRQGRRVRWADLGDVALEFSLEQPADPTRTEPSTASPPSADSGGTPPATSTP